MFQEPFVSVVTPVYNGEAFIAQCIEGVLAQDYDFREYIIVNNCSTDRTFTVAQQYAGRDPRIRVVTNATFVSCEENHNSAFRQIASDSKYCKVVSADDLLRPHALRKMVSFAVQHPTVGIVGSYEQSGNRVKWKGLPENVTVLSGREVCRMGLLQGIHLVGSPMSVLYRSDLLRRSESFFPHSQPHADTSACYANLHDCDFGFIHEILTVERIHQGQLSRCVERLNADALAYIEILIQYGPLYLTETELTSRLDELLARYYRLLGGCVLKLKGRAFWNFHQSRLMSLGYSLDRRRVLVETVHEFLSELGTPLQALHKFKCALAEKIYS